MIIYVVKDNEGNIEGIFQNYLDAKAFSLEPRRWPVVIETHELR